VDIAHVDHVEFHVGDADSLADQLCSAYGFELLGQGGPGGALPGQCSLLLGLGDIRLLLTTGVDAAHPAARFVRRHGDGVATIALRTADATQAYTEAVARGARPVEPPRVWQYGDAVVVTAGVSGFGDITHRFVERRSGDAFLPGAVNAPLCQATDPAELLQTVDHFAVCVPAADFDDTILTYQRVFGFDQIFEERIRVGAQAMNSKVVQNLARTVTLTVIAPDPTAEPGQIDEFLRNQDGAGVQHLALSTADIVTAVDTFERRGVRFLSTPASYYEDIRRRLGDVALPIERLRAGNVLVDRDHWGEMFQVFTQSTFTRRTFFFELIERHGALTFGTNNIKALYEAKERDRAASAART